MKKLCAAALTGFLFCSAIAQAQCEGVWRVQVVDAITKETKSYLMTPGITALQTPKFKNTKCEIEIRKLDNGSFASISCRHARGSKESQTASGSGSCVNSLNPIGFLSFMEATKKGISAYHFEFTSD